MKQFFLSIFLTASFAMNAVATDPLDKFPAIVIDTIYMSSGALVVEYEVLRQFDQIHMNIQASRSQTINPVLLSGNTGKGKTSIPVSLITDQATCFNVFLKGGQFANKGDTADYHPTGYDYAIFNKQLDNSVKQFRTRYTEQEKSIMDEQMQNRVFIRNSGQFEGIGFSDTTKSSVIQRYDPLAVDTYNTQAVPLHEDDSFNGSSRSVYTFNISGNVRTAPAGNGWRTFIPATDVFLKFRNSSQPNDLIYFYDTNYPCTLFEGVHYSRTDGSGNFSFNFSIDASLINYLNINEAIIFVARDNEYVALSVSGPILQYNCNVDVPVFWDNSFSTIAINHGLQGIQVTNKEIVVNEFMMASSLGMFWYTGKMTNQLNWTLSRVPVYETDVPQSNYTGQFNPVTIRINLNKNRSVNPYNMFGTPAHEYGHFVHFMMWGLANFAFASEKTCESFAMFYSYAARHFAFKNGFGVTTPPGATNEEIIRETRNNFDIAPFPKHWNNDPYNIHFSYPDYAPWASYLWELFDGHPTFQAVNSDNDDMAYPWRVINAWNSIQNIFKTIDDFPGAFKSGLSVDEQASVNSIYDFTVGNSSVRMRSQTFHTTSMGTSSNNLLVSLTHVLYGMNPYFPATDILNSPTSFRVYRRLYIDQPWELLGQIPYVTNQTSYSQTFNVGTTATLYNYRMTVNNAGGESAYPALLTHHNNTTPSSCNMVNQTISTNTTLNNCANISVTGVTVTNNAKLTLIATGEVTIENLEIQSGSHLEIN